MIIFLCFIFGLFLTDCQTETVVKEDVKVEWSNTTGADTNTDTHPSLPDKIVLNISINNETVVLNLTKVQNDTFEDVPVILGDNNENNHLWNHSQYEQFSTYNDKLKVASFSVVMNKEHGKPTTEYYGFFVHNDIKYSLVPKQFHEKSNKTTDVVHKFNLNGTDYVVYKDTTERTTSNETEKDAITPEADNNYTTNLKNGNTNETSRSERRKRSLNMNLVVDLLVVVDYSMYERWFQLTSKSKDDTIKRIRYYLAHVINGVNNVYSTMQGHKLSVKVVAIYIAQMKQQSNFTEDPKVHINKDNNKRIDYAPALDNFRHWVVEKQKNVLPPGNVAIAFTDYDDTPTTGVAYIGSVCTNNSVVIAREKGQFDTITTVAHEIGHVLGSEHDEDDTTLCPESEQYLMSPTMSSSHLQNRDKLSSCSIDYITNKVNDLESQGINCLDSSKKQTKEEDLRKHLDTMPGLHFGLDEQCKLKFGNSYKYCSEGKDTHLICNNMKCTKGETCEIGHPIALNGTFCGKNKWCINGECVSGNPNFTTDKDTCFFGDKSDAFIFNNVTLTCKIVETNPSYCYGKVGEWCCESCDKIKKQKKSKIIGCEYGDKGMSFEVNSIVYGCEGAIQHPFVCQDTHGIEQCCETCHQVNKGSKPPTVKPPTVNTYRIPTRNPRECIDETNFYLDDQPFDCNSLFNDPGKCYKRNRNCCATCTQIKQQKGNKQICPYGDQDFTFAKNSVNYKCAQAVQSIEHFCKKPAVAPLCCETCKTSQGQISSS